VRRGGVLAAAGIAYLALGALAWWHVLGGGMSHTLAAQGYGDPDQEVWFLAWMPYALGHGLNPFVSHAMFAPRGINLMENTSILLPAFVLSPVTVLFGPVAAFDVACVMAPAASAFAAFVAFSRFSPSKPAAFVGALFYGFSPFVLHDLADGHLHVTILVLPPLILLVLDDLVVRRRGSAVGRGALLGALLAAQFLTSLEVTAMVVILSAAGIVLLAVRFPSRLRERLEQVAGGLAAAVLTGGILVAYPAYVLFSGPRRYTGSVFPHPEGYVVWLKAIVWPAGGSPPAVWAGYAGIPVLLLAVVGGLLLVRSQKPRNPTVPPESPATPTISGSPLEEAIARQPAVLRFSLVLAAVAYLLAMGRSVHLTPKVGTGIPLPDALLAHVPLLENMLPVRYAAMADLFLGLALAVTLDRIGRLPGRRLPGRRLPGRRLPGRRLPGRRLPLTSGLAVATLGAAALVSPFLGSGWPYAARHVNVPAVYRSPLLTSRLGRGTVLVGQPIPNGFLADPLVWQADEAMPYALVAGYGFVPGPHGRPVGSLQPNSVSNAFADAQVGLLPPVPSQRQVMAVRRQLRAWGVSAVVLLPVPKQPGRLAALVQRVIGAPPRRIDGAWVWTGVHWG
jgi:hypothetical protein